MKKKSFPYVIGFLLGFFGNFIFLFICLFFGGDYRKGALHGFLAFWLLVGVIILIALIVLIVNF